VLTKLTLAVVAAIMAASTTTTTAPPPAKAELLIDVDTGRALFAQNEHTPLPPGSLSKILTALVAAAWIPPGTPVPVNPDDATVYPDRVGMKPGQTWPYDITMRALLIDSANDAAYALAERISGSLANFTILMQEAARQIGMRDHPVLEDPAGLDSTEGYDGGNRISAWDLAIAARDMMANPYLAAIAGTKKYVFTGPDGIVYSILNHNLGFLNAYPGAIGVKTGYTDAAGVCVVAEAERGGRKMMAVVLAGSSPDATAEALLDRGFATPVAAEQVNAPTLPAVTEPGPAPPNFRGESAKNARMTESALQPDPVVSKKAAAQWMLYAELGGGVAAVAVVALLYRHRRVTLRRRLGAEPIRR
jgi:D-alanyl-D-alanine carboxypeptidase (penicillin-binding protein 5/6)